MTSGKQGIAIEALRDALQGLQIPGSGSYLERDAPSQPLECFAGKPIGPTAREALLFPLFDNAMTGQAHQCTGGRTCSGNFRFCIGLPNRSPTIPRRRRTMRVRAVGPNRTVGARVTPALTDKSRAFARGVRSSLSLRSDTSPTSSFNSSINLAAIRLALRRTFATRRAINKARR
jgi:hypothetical protein